MDSSNERPDLADEPTSDGISRRSFVQGVVAASAGVGLTFTPLPALSFPALDPATGGLTALGRRAVACVTNHLIPPDAAMPGAGDVGAVAWIEDELRNNADLWTAITRVLAELPDADVLHQMTADDVRARLADVERAHPAAFGHLVEATYRGYYRHPAVLAALGRI